MIPSQMNFIVFLLLYFLADFPNVVLCTTPTHRVLDMARSSSNSRGRRRFKDDGSYPTDGSIETPNKDGTVKSSGLKKKKRKKHKKHGKATRQQRQVRSVQEATESFSTSNSVLDSQMRRTTHNPRTHKTIEGNISAVVHRAKKKKRRKQTQSTPAIHSESSSPNLLGVGPQSFLRIELENHRWKPPGSLTREATSNELSQRGHSFPNEDWVPAYRQTTHQRGQGFSALYGYDTTGRQNQVAKHFLTHRPTESWTTTQMGNTMTSTMNPFHLWVPALVSTAILSSQELRIAEERFEISTSVGSAALGMSLPSEESGADGAPFSSLSLLQIEVAPIMLHEVSRFLFEGVSLEEAEQMLMNSDVVPKKTDMDREFLPEFDQVPVETIDAVQGCITSQNEDPDDASQDSACQVSDNAGSTEHVEPRSRTVDLTGSVKSMAGDTSQATTVSPEESRAVDTFRVSTGPTLGNSIVFQPKATITYDDITRDDEKSSSKKDESDLTVSVVTWNLAEDSPSEEDATFLQTFRRSKSRSRLGSDFVLVSGQECENIKPRRTEGHRSREFRRLMIKMLGKQFVPIAMHQLGGIQFALFCRREILSDIENVFVADVTCGIGNVFHNKGAIGAFVKVKARNPSGPKRATSLRMLFVTSHMAAHVKNYKARDSDFWRIITELESQAPDDFLTNVKPTERGSNLIESMDRVFFCGDLNYRLDLPREMVEFQLSKLDSEHTLEPEERAREIRLDLLRHDQLLNTMAEQRAFPGLAEGEIRFQPTFKYDKRSTEFDTSHKQRVPSWTDRILFKPNGIRVLQYDSVSSATHSDHRPVFGSFRVSRRGRKLT